MNLTKDEVLLVRTLAMSKVGLHLYTIFRRAGLAAPAMSKALASLQGSGVINLEDEVASFTQKGHAWLSKQPSLLFAPQARLKDRLDRTVSPSRVPQFKGPSIGINVLYVPRTSELPRSLLKAIADKSN